MAYRQRFMHPAAAVYVDCQIDFVPDGFANLLDLFADFPGQLANRQANEVIG